MKAKVKKTPLAKVMSQKAAAKKAMDTKVQGAGLLKLVNEGKKRDARFKRAG